MSGELREVLNYPNWMWIIGVLLLALVLVWVGVWLIRWLRFEPFAGTESDRAYSLG